MAITPNSPLVTPQWLVDHLSDPDLVIVDCRFSLADADQGCREYTAGHIPAAHYLHLNQDLSSPVGHHGGRHPLPDLGLFQQRLAQIGVNSYPPSPVVAYDDSQGVFAARLWWLLRYLGHGAVAVLDGGWRGWQSGGYPVTDQRPLAAQPGDFRPQLQSDWLVDIEAVRRSQHQPGCLLIDSRAPERYRGEVEPIDPVAGHIPGAVNYCWQEVLQPNGLMRPPGELADHWQGLDGREAVVYCGSGVTACVNLLSQAVAGKPLARFYLGGWSDWCSYGRSSK